MRPSSEKVSIEKLTGSINRFFPRPAHLFMKMFQPMKQLKEQPTTLTCFKAYDVRGALGINLGVAIVYRMGRSVAQHFQATNIVVGFDARKTSPELATATIQ